MTAEEALKPAVVVAGASRGIGRAIAKVAAREGSPVVLVGRAPEQLAGAARDVQAVGGQTFALELDLVSPKAALRLQDFLTDNGLYCDTLVNSAGYGLRGPATGLPLDGQLGIIDLNVRALTDLTLTFLPAMVKRRRGGVLNIGSIAGFTPGPNMALYYASKSFVRSFSEALHEELRHTGVTVTCVAPGPVETEFLSRSGAGRAMLFKVLPRLDADRVAERAWRAYRSGRRLAVPGASAKIVALVARMLPSAVIVPLIGRLQRRSADPCLCGSGLKYADCCGKHWRTPGTSDRAAS